jgi:hypothetical protein
MTRVLGIVCCTGLLLSVGAAQPPTVRDLTADEEPAVKELGEKTLKARTIWKGKIYLANIEVVLDNRAKPPARHAILTYYRYDGDLGVQVMVRLDKMTVTGVEIHPHMPVSLAPEEMAEAEKIAREHPEIKKALAKYKHLDKIEADIMVGHTSDPEVPGFQHRVARLFFRDAQRNFLSNVPMVDVDLTSGEVRFDLFRSDHDKK